VTVCDEDWSAPSVEASPGVGEAFGKPAGSERHSRKTGAPPMGEKGGWRTVAYIWRN